MIIGVAGYKGSGKDTIGTVLTNSFNFKKLSFAQPIKDLVHDTFGIDKNILQGNGGERIFRELEMPEWFNLTPRQLLQKEPGEKPPRSFQRHFKGSQRCQYK